MTAVIITRLPYIPPKESVQVVRPTSGKCPNLDEQDAIDARRFQTARFNRKRKGD